MIHVNWYDDNDTVLSMRFDGAWTLLQLEQALRTACELLAANTHCITIMITLSATMAIPPRGFVRGLQYMVRLHQECNLKTIIHVATNADTLRLWQEAIQTFPIDLTLYHFVSTEEEARKILQ